MSLVTKTKIRWAVVAVASGLLSFACSCGGSDDSGGSGGTTSVSCYYAPTKAEPGNCSQYENEPNAEVTLEVEQCAKKGTPGSHCPATAQLSGCCSARPSSGAVGRATCDYAATSSTASQLSQQIMSTMTFCADSDQDYSASIP